MKPLKLTICAFGSFPEKEVVDFSKLGNKGLYLISGKTGAGKTTIFDGISFALFGKASGKARSDNKELRSHFADETTKTYVELEFLLGEDLYVINRRLNNSGPVARLTLPDGSEIRVMSDINAKIKEIIGLNQEQFSQIVMIAQNDFLRFLQSGTDKRQEILRHIFKTKCLESFAENLKLRAKEIKTEKDLCARSFDKYNVDVYQRQTQFASWEQEIKRCNEELSEIEISIKKNGQRKTDLTIAITKGEENNRFFDELAEKRRLKQNHDEKKSDMEELSRKAQKGENALYNVKPAADKAADTRKTYEDAAESFDISKDEVQKQSAKAKEAEEYLASLASVGDAEDKLRKLEREFENERVRLEGLNKLNTNYERMESDREALSVTRQKEKQAEKQTESGKELQDKQNQLTELKSRLAESKAAMVNLEKYCEDYSAIKRKQGDLARIGAEFETLNKKYNENYQKYNTIYEAFLREQGGILAQTLTEGAPCPVCGSAEHPCPAQLSGEEITKSAVNKASAAMEKTRSDREKKSSESAALISELETLSATLRENLTPFLPKDCTEPFLLINELSEKAKTDYDSLDSEVAEKEADYLKEKENYEKAKKELEEAVLNRNALEAGIKTLEEQFLKDFCEYSEDAALETAKERLEAMLEDAAAKVKDLDIKKGMAADNFKSLSEKHHKAVQEKHEADTALEAAKALLTERGKKVEEAREAHNKAENEYHAQRDKNGFSNDEEYLAAIITPKRLTEYKKTLSEYEKSGESLIENISRLEKETEGRERQDLARLKEEYQAEQLCTAELTGERDELKQNLDDISKKLYELVQEGRKFEALEKEYLPVSKLAKIADGNLKFESYVQTAYFQQVLEAANRQLKILSTGRYSLRRKESGGDKRGAVGLDLEVYDSHTSKLRSANSLSGGEAFMTSLTLALGLSDVIQQNAGGIRVDAMFIDEGFGTLDNEVLQLSVQTLSDLAGGHRLIGIISHVTELKEQISRQIQVTKTNKGSKISIK